MKAKIRSIQSSATPDQGHHMETLQNHKKTPNKREQRGQCFPSRWPQGYNVQTRKHDRHKTVSTKGIHKQSTVLRRAIKITGTLQLVLWYQPHPWFWWWSRQIYRRCLVRMKYPKTSFASLHWLSFEYSKNLMFYLSVYWSVWFVNWIGDNIITSGKLSGVPLNI